jgi:hypothetical protein
VLEHESAAAAALAPGAMVTTFVVMISRAVTPFRIAPGLARRRGRRRSGASGRLEMIPATWFSATTTGSALTA